MVRRFGTLGFGVFLTLGLTTGCITPGDYANQLPPVKTAPRTAPPTLQQVPIQARVAQPTPPAQPLDMAPPKPPPPPEFVDANTLPEPQPIESTISVHRVPTEANEAAVLMGLRCALEKRDPEMLEALQKHGYDQRTQEVLVPLLAVAARVSEGGVDSVSPQEMAKLCGQVEQLKAALRAKTPLSVEKICYCRRISNYGLYDPLPNDHNFIGGDRRHVELVQLYVEARNFASKQNGNLYETSLASTLELKNNQSGKVVFRRDFPAEPDHSLSPRQDYFIHYQFYVPAQMEPGEYTLTISLHDENATGEQRKQTATRSLPFRVVAEAPARAAR